MRRQIVKNNAKEVQPEANEHPNKAARPSTLDFQSTALKLLKSVLEPKQLSTFHHPPP
ncbi:hypothetical protein M378DRAFT_160502 [Amanita muscaria Koide BX008]|uniref:Uncharacterized protein n=1 Tax=Amanita muscaria (strain Koide BX008) TaxID=946122 RepID=A0A0C2ST55_AMAMK|nr:hypothetical protein M378DRAFT_160502 [Amanita muscaria Koide BX008]